MVTLITGFTTWGCHIMKLWLHLLFGETYQETNS